MTLHCPVACNHLSVMNESLSILISETLSLIFDFINNSKIINKSEMGIRLKSK